MEGKRGAVWVAALVAGAFGASGAGALSLADLAAGGGFTAANGVSFGAFTVKVRGNLSRDLTDYEVVATEDGFYVTGDAVPRRRARAARGRIQIRYDVGTSDPGGLLEGTLAIQPGEERVSAKGKLFDGRKRIGKLAADSLGDLYDSMGLGGVAALHVSERIRLDGGFVRGWVSSSFTTVPEPSTALLVGAGLAAAAAARRRRA
jgi:PEP-CTERM motif-containing protein